MLQCVTEDAPVVVVNEIAKSRRVDDGKVEPDTVLFDIYHVTEDELNIKLGAKATYQHQCSQWRRFWASPQKDPGTLWGDKE